MRLGFQRELCAQVVGGTESAGFQPHVLVPIAHAVAFGKSSAFCLEKVAVGLDCHEMPREREGVGREGI